MQAQTCTQNTLYETRTLLTLWLNKSYNHLLSLSIIVTVALSLLVTPPGNEDPLMMRLNVSDSSRMLSSVIGTLNVTSFFPATIVTVYGPVL